MNYKINNADVRCLECGEEITPPYRSDKVFCTPACRSRYHNRKVHAIRLSHNHVMSAINKNYEILDTLLRRNVCVAELNELILSGFSPEFVTGYRRVGKRVIYSCYEIQYCLWGSRINCLQRIMVLSGEDAKEY